jgi:hypothetical protein
LKRQKFLYSTSCENIFQSCRIKIEIVIHLFSTRWGNSLSVIFFIIFLKIKQHKKNKIWNKQKTSHQSLSWKWFVYEPVNETKGNTRKFHVKNENSIWNCVRVEWMRERLRNLWHILLILLLFRRKLISVHWTISTWFLFDPEKRLLPFFFIEFEIPLKII